MDVTDVLRDRMQEPAGLNRMVTISSLLHGAAILAVVIAPQGFLTPASEAPQSIMTISLDGAGVGPRSGGMTPIGGRPVQVQTPPDEPPKREAVRAPASRTPEMTLPKPGAKPLKADPARTGLDERRSSTATRGPEVRPGNAVAETGARGMGFGLSTGGGPGTGAMLDVGDFCCPDYVALMIERIRSGWNQQSEVGGTVIVRFTIERDGRITDPFVEQSSGYTTLDINAERAVRVTRQLPPLPAAFPNPTLTVHLNFQYQR
jgi:TonB family protein